MNYWVVCLNHNDFRKWIVDNQINTKETPVKALRTDSSGGGRGRPYDAVNDTLWFTAASTIGEHFRCVLEVLRACGVPDEDIDVRIRDVELFNKITGNGGGDLTLSFPPILARPGSTPPPHLRPPPVPPSPVPESRSPLFATRRQRRAERRRG